MSTNSSSAATITLAVPHVRLASVILESLSEGLQKKMYAITLESHDGMVYAKSKPEARMESHTIPGILTRNNEADQPCTFKCQITFDTPNNVSEVTASALRHRGLKGWFAAPFHDLELLYSYTGHLQQCFDKFLETITPSQTDFKLTYSDQHQVDDRTWIRKLNTDVPSTIIHKEIQPNGKEIVEEMEEIDLNVSVVLISALEQPTNGAAPPDSELQADEVSNS